MSPVDTFGLTLFILLLFLGILLCIHGLPGMVLIIADVLVYSIITGFEKIGWPAILALCFVAVAVETADVFFSMKGSPRFSPSKQSVLISFAGSCLFALLLTPSFLIIGLVGGFFLGGVLGMLCALMIQETKLKPTYRMPFSVLIGRTSTLFVKGSVATALVYFTLLFSYD
jgi:uncharacterized protein YqgC (DUF456 family)